MGRVAFHPCQTRERVRFQPPHQRVRTAGHKRAGIDNIYFVFRANLKGPLKRYARARTISSSLALRTRVWNIYICVCSMCNGISADRSGILRGKCARAPRSGWLRTVFFGSIPCFGCASRLSRIGIPVRCLLPVADDDAGVPSNTTLSHFQEHRVERAHVARRAAPRSRPSVCVCVCECGTLFHFHSRPLGNKRRRRQQRRR